MAPTRREFLSMMAVLTATTGLSSTHAHAAAVAAEVPGSGAARPGRRPGGSNGAAARRPDAAAQDCSLPIPSQSSASGLG